MKLDHILFPIDFSEQSRNLNGQVEWLANRFGSRVTLLHVFEIPSSWYGDYEAPLVNTEALNAIADAEKRRLFEYQINVPEARVERILAEGEAAWHILDWAKNHEVDLIVMGTHGYGRIRGLLLGSVTAKIIHTVECTVWTQSMAHANMKVPKEGVANIVCSLELTEEAVPLLQFTKDVANEFGAKVRLVHSVPEAETRPNKYFDFDLHRYLTESARVDISRLQRQAGTEFPLTIVGGGISKAVSAIALERGADLVIIGRGKAQEQFGRLRSHAYEIVRDAPCPVLSYSLSQRDRTFSSCNARRPSQYGASERLLTGSRKL
jgi:nucleotide-binding universal stress UspA family protein